MSGCCLTPLSQFKVISDVQCKISHDNHCLFYGGDNDENVGFFFLKLEEEEKSTYLAPRT